MLLKLVKSILERIKFLIKLGEGQITINSKFFFLDIVLFYNVFFGIAGKGIPLN